MTQEQRSQFLNSLSDEEIQLFEKDWYIWARPAQRLPEQQFLVWLIQAGRGFGKTRTGAETIRLWHDMGYSRFAIIGQTPADVRDVMIEGESGLLSVCPKWDMPEYQPSKRRLVWADGAVALIFSGANPEQLRGPQHEKAWADEIFAWQYPQETWDMMMFGLRLGDNPQVIVTSTPKPLPIIKHLRSLPSTYVTHGTTYDNRANLAPAFYNEIITKYEGTRLGRQELNAEILDDNPSALWSRETLDKLRTNKAPDLVRIVVGIDPQARSIESACETGIVVAGKGIDGHAYVLNDASLTGKPHDWANAAIAEYYKHRADRIVGEANNGGEMVESTVITIDEKVAFKMVYATKGKYTRAEPVSALYEKGKVHHVGTFGALEDQMCEWEIGMDSPDRLDALVWTLTELMLDGKTVPIVLPGSITGSRDTIHSEGGNPRGRIQKGST